MDEILRVLDDPWMIWCDVVGNEIEDQVQASFRKFSSSSGEAFRTSELLINYIAAHAIRGSYIVFWTKIRKCALETIEQVLVLVRDCDAARTSFPNSH